MLGQDFARLRYFLNYSDLFSFTSSCCAGIGHWEQLTIGVKRSKIQGLSGEAFQRTEAAGTLEGARRLSFMASSIALILAPRAGASR